MQRSIHRMLPILFGVLTLLFAACETNNKPDILTAPSNLTANIASHSGIDLAWDDNSSDEEGYIVERSENDGGFDQIAVQRNSNTYQDTTVSLGIAYGYRVKAFSGTLFSDYSNTVNVTLATGPPRAPEGLSAVPDGKTITLAWQDQADNESSFRVERQKEGEAFIAIKTLGQNSVSYTDTGLDASTTYSYRVRAANSAGFSDWSDTATAVTGDGPPLLVVDPENGPYRTISQAMAQVNAGETIWVKAGIYHESVVFSKSGSQSQGYVTLSGEAGAVIDGTGVSGEDLVTISNKSYVRLMGFEIRNHKQNGTSFFPKGIHVSGSGSHIEIRNNTVWGIENTHANAGAHGIAVYGNSNTALSDIVIHGNTIHSCKLGWSEAMVLNGNVTGFTVSNNTVHDNNNIGIDFIGFEGTCPTPSLDQAREGVCSGNRVYNITSETNPSYGGDRSADGIYVDGGRDIIIEKNTVDNCDIGIELASEHKGKSTSGITIRNNMVSRSYQGNIQMGGYAANRGNAHHISVVNNTTYKAREGEVVIQFNTSDVTVSNNIFVAESGREYISEWGYNNSGITLNTNMYDGASTSEVGAWNDANPLFDNPELTAPPGDLHIKATSPAKNAGLDLGALSGTLDIDGQERVNGTIDIGADEL